MLNIAHTCLTEGVNGPGRRFTVWVQGCRRDCPGCFNPELRADRPARLVRPDALAREALRHGPVDGLTLSGGEPFDQAGALCAFLDAWRAATPVPCIAFTGYRWEELRRGAPPLRALLGRVDLLVDGPYRDEQRSELPLRGSANQRLIPRTAVGRRLAARAGRGGQGTFQVMITGGGEVLLTGFPPEAVVRGVTCAP